MPFDDADDEEEGKSESETGDYFVDEEEKSDDCLRAS